MKAWVLAFGLFGAVWAESAWAGSLWSYLADYRVALELRNHTNASNLEYRAPRSLGLPSNCALDPEYADKLKCNTHLAEANPNPWGLSIQQVFRRQGWFYGNFGSGASFFFLDGKRSAPAFVGGGIEDTDPVRQGRIHLYGASVKGYYEFGLTPPEYAPDILLSIGLGGHFSKGNLKVNEVRQDVEVQAMLTYVQLEVVWLRFGDGALSSYFAGETVQPRALGKPFGDLVNFKLSPSSNTLGILKLVLPFSTKALR